MGEEDDRVIPVPVGRHDNWDPENRYPFGHAPLGDMEVEKIEDHKSASGLDTHGFEAFVAGAVKVVRET